MNFWIISDMRAGAVKGWDFREPIRRVAGDVGVYSKDRKASGKSHRTDLSLPLLQGQSQLNLC